MTALLLVLWSLSIWTEATAHPFRYSVPTTFTFATLDDCRNARDLFLLLLKPNERASGCDQA